MHTHRGGSVIFHPVAVTLGVFAISAALIAATLLFFASVMKSEIHSAAP
ncbi:MAG: hypothetical protein Q4D85_02140 [Corynebacterium sp.]|nr:hypothetical protein [Corynebacterium sp.]